MYQPTVLPAAKLKRLLQILEGIKAGNYEREGKEVERNYEILSSQQKMPRIHSDMRRCPQAICK